MDKENYFSFWGYSRLILTFLSCVLFSTISIAQLNISFEGSEGYVTSAGKNGLQYVSGGITYRQPEQIAPVWTGTVSGSEEPMLKVVPNEGNGSDNALFLDNVSSLGKRFEIQPRSDLVGKQLVNITGKLNFSFDLKYTALQTSGSSPLKIDFGMVDANNVAVEIDILNNGKIAYQNALALKTATINGIEGGTNHYIAPINQYITISGVIDYTAKNFTLKVNNIPQNSGSPISFYKGIPNWFCKLRLQSQPSSNYTSLYLDNIKLSDGDGTTPMYDGSRKWWVFMSPNDAKSLYNSHWFSAIQADAETYQLGDSPYGKTSLDHASYWLFDMQTSQEILTSVYMALKHGKYNGSSNAETQKYLDRIVSNWKELMTAGPAEMFTISQPLDANTVLNHNDPALPFKPGWYEGGIALRDWLSGALQSYDGIRDDISVSDRQQIDTWLFRIGTQMWDDFYTHSAAPDIRTNQPLSANTQAQVIALLLQNRLLFEEYFNTPNNGLKYAYNYMQSPYNPSVTHNMPPDLKGFPQEFGTGGDSPHGTGMVKHALHGIATLAYVAHNGGDANWNVYANPIDAQLQTEVLDTWYRVATDLNDEFTDYCSKLDALGKSVHPLNQTLIANFWDGFAYLQPRFLEIGNTVGPAKWTYPGTDQNLDFGGMSFRAIHEILRKERARIFNELSAPTAPAPKSLWNSGLNLQKRFIAQNGSFDAIINVKHADTNGGRGIYLQNYPSHYNNCKILAGIKFNANGAISVSNGANTSNSTVMYKANINYVVRFNVNAINKTYSVFLKPENQPEQTIATNVALASSTDQTIRCFSLLNQAPYMEVWDFKTIWDTSTSSFVSVNDITISQEAATMTLGGSSLALSATISPSEATDKTVIWSSSNTNVATVNTSGVVTPVAVGDAIITASSFNRTKLASCAVTVNVSSTAVSNTYNDQNWEKTVCAGANCKMLVYDIHGQLLIENNYDGNLTTPHYLQSGLYIIKITSANGSFERKMLIKKPKY